MAEQERTVETRHEMSADRMPDWKKVRTFLAGQRRLKAEQTTYLPKLPGQVRFVVDGQVVDEYQNYLMRATPLTAYAQRVLNGLIGMVFRHDPVFTVPTALEEDLDNLTLCGDSAKAFARQVFQENISTSFGGILTDWSTSRGRAYQRLYCAESIVNWRYEIIDNVPTLTQLTLLEMVEEPHPSGFGSRPAPRWIVLELSPGIGGQALGLTRTIYQRTEDGRNIYSTGTTIVTRLEDPLPFIPFVPFNFRRAGTIDILSPAIMELIDLIHAHYLLDADLKNLLHYCGAGIFLFGAGFSESEQEVVRAGSGNYFFSTNPQASLAYVQSNGEAGTEIRAEIEGKKREMAVAFARLLLSEQQRSAETAEAQNVAFAGDDATLQGVVRATDDALSMAMRHHAWWAGESESWTEESAAVELNDDFITSQMSTDDLVRLGTELEQGHLSYATYWWNVTKGERTIPGRTIDEEQRAIAKEQAERERKQRMQQERDMAGRPPFARIRDLAARVQNSETEDAEDVLEREEDAMSKKTMPRGSMERPPTNA